MKKIIALYCCMLPFFVVAQTIQVGDSVRVKQTTEVYLTGEKISTWVYGETHMISQVGTQRFPNGVLLDIQGARSWLGENDVEVIGRVISQPTPASEPKFESKPEPKPEPQPVLPVQPVLESAVEPTPELDPEPELAPVVASKPTTPTAQPSERIEKTPVKTIKPSTPATFQMYGTLGVLVGNQTYGVTADLVFGAKLNPYVLVGGGLGFHTWVSDLEKHGNYALLLPLYADARAYLPIIGKNVTPFLEVGLGGWGGAINKSQDDQLSQPFKFGLYAKTAIGIELNKSCISIGYDYGPAHNAWVGWGIYFQ